MSDILRDEDAQRAERRAFLEQCGRFAVVTPPVVALMLTVGDKAALATSATTSTKPISTSGAMMLTPGSGEPREAHLATVVDSMGLMKS